MCKFFLESYYNIVGIIYSRQRYEITDINVAVNMNYIFVYPLAHFRVWTRKLINRQIQGNKRTLLRLFFYGYDMLMGHHYPKSGLCGSKYKIVFLLFLNRLFIYISTPLLFGKKSPPFLFCNMVLHA